MYIKGPIVNTWVHKQYHWLQTQLQGGIHEDNARLAMAIIDEEFIMKFTSSLEQERTRATLHEGKAMQGYDFDEYVAWFELLVQKAGY